MNVASTPVSPAALRAYVASLPPGPPTPGLVELQQRSLASSPDGVAADPLAAPGGSAEELAWQDRQRTLRQQLKVLLAGSKLHAGLTAAALGYADEPARAGASSDPAAVADQVAQYAGSDLLCYFAEDPAALVARQEASWGPVLARALAEVASSSTLCLVIAPTSTAIPRGTPSCRATR